MNDILGFLPSSVILSTIPNTCENQYLIDSDPTEKRRGFIRGYLNSMLINYGSGTPLSSPDILTSTSAPPAKRVRNSTGLGGSGSSSKKPKTAKEKEKEQEASSDKVLFNPQITYVLPDSESPLPFLIRPLETKDIGGGTYHLSMTSASMYLKKKLVELALEQKYGGLAQKVWTMISTYGKMEEKTITKLTKFPGAEVRKHLFTMQKDGFLQCMVS